MSNTHQNVSGCPQADPDGFPVHPVTVLPAINGSGNLFDPAGGSAPPASGPTAGPPEPPSRQLRLPPAGEFFEPRQLLLFGADGYPEGGRP